MTKNYLISLFALIAVGCGGSTGGSPQTFTGHWIGTWSNATDGGTADITIAPSGAVSGTLVSQSANGTLTGDCDLTGDLGNQGTVQFGANPSATYSGNFIKHDNFNVIAAELDFQSAPDIDLSLTRQ